MMAKKLDVGIISALIAGFPAIAVSQDANPLRIEKADETSVTKTIPAGTRVEVVLPVQLGTGYSWNLVAPDNINSVASLLRVEIGELDTDLPGGSESQKFTFKTKDVGSLKLEFRLARARYMMNATDVYIVNLNVK